MPTMKRACSCDEESGLRKGPWTLDEDNLLLKYISCHGEGRWNFVAKSAGLKRTGKSCRLRWLNYLKPDVKRGNLTPQEQLLILELHSKWGNRWSKIAHHLPGRTDNEIKNYWRTRVQKQARQQKFKNNSVRFVDAIRQFWAFTMLPKTDNLDPHPVNFAASSLVTAHLEAPMLSSPSSAIAHSCFNASHLSSTTTSSTSSSQLGHNYGIPEISEHSPMSPFGFESILNSHEILNCDIPLIGECSYDTENCMSSMDTYDFPTNCGIGDGDWVSGDMESSIWNMDELW